MYKKTNVVFIINNFLVGGVERLLFDIIPFFNKEKYNIKIVTVFGSGPLETSFRKLGIPIYFAGSSKFFSKNLSFKLYCLLISPITLLRITFFLLKSKPDVVVTSLYQADVLGMIASRIVGVKKRILIQHDIVYFGIFKRFIKKIFAIQFSTQFVSISETVKNFLVEYFDIKKDNITTIYNGINYERFEKGRKLTPISDSPVIGIVGRLETIKGHIYALEALKIIKEKNGLSPITFLAGGGSLRNDLDIYTKKNNLNNIKFFGNVDNIPEFLRKIDILIVPSVSEGFCLVILEGMVSGKVVISSDILVMKELIKDGKTGLLFKSQDSESLAEILLKVLMDKELCKKLQENAFSFTKQNKELFDTKEVSKNYQKLISK